MIVNDQFVDYHACPKGTGSRLRVKIMQIPATTNWGMLKMANSSQNLKALCWEPSVNIKAAPKLLDGWEICGPIKCR